MEHILDLEHWVLGWIIGLDHWQGDPFDTWVQALYRINILWVPLSFVKLKWRFQEDLVAILHSHKIYHSSHFGSTLRIESVEVVAYPIWIALHAPVASAARWSLPRLLNVSTTSTLLAGTQSGSCRGTITNTSDCLSIFFFWNLWLVAYTQHSCSMSFNI